jgi:hypothetical protein
MLRKLVLPLCLATAAATGCDDDATTSSEDGGSSDDATGELADAGLDGGDGGGDAGRGRLQSGTYAVSNVVKLEDGCLLKLEDGTFTSTELTNTGTEISVGRRYDATTDPSWTPAGYGLGKGPYSTATTATLSTSAHVRIAADGCEFDIARTSQITFIGDNSVAVDYTDQETNQNASCKASNGVPTQTCSSHYTFTLTREGT